MGNTKQIEIKWEDFLMQGDSESEFAPMMSIFMKALIFTSREIMGGNLGRRKILDLGSGAGYVLFNFAREGCIPYGIEREDKAIVECNEKLRGSGLRRPQIIKADYLKDNLSEVSFEDGSRMADMDLFIHHSYNDVHSMRTLVTSLAQWPLKMGTAINFCSYPYEYTSPLEMRVIHDLGFDIIRGQKFPIPFLVKTREAGVCLKDIETLRKKAREADYDWPN